MISQKISDLSQILKCGIFPSTMNISTEHLKKQYRLNLTQRRQITIAPSKMIYMHHAFKTHIIPFISKHLHKQHLISLTGDEKPINP